MDKKTNALGKLNILVPVMAIYPFLSGIFYDWAVFISLVINSALLFSFCSRKKSIGIYIDVKSVAGLVILLSSGLSVIPAFSKGDAILGIARILSVSLFALILMQTEEEERRRTFDVIPYAGILMIIVSAIAYVIPDIRQFAFESSRLAGLFGYANTMALFLLFGVIIEIDKMKDSGKESRGIKEIALCAGLLFGILWTGSRTSLVITFILLVFYLVRYTEIRKRILVLAAGLVLAIAAAALIMGLTDSFGRIATFSLSSSTFIGRVLYMQDALPVIASHPLGLGYLGYMFIQPVIQTGVYNVRFVHNEYLQILLDYGWVAFAAFICFLAVGIKGLLEKKKDMELVLVVCTLVHVFLDFDLQYLVIVYILLMCMDWNSGRRITVSTPAVYSFSAVVAILSAWLVIPFSVKDMDPWLARSLCPWSYEITETLTMNSEDVSTVEDGAKRMLEMNPYSYEAYNALGDVALYRGDIGDLMDKKWKCLEIGAFHEVFYEEFRDILDYAENSGSPALSSKAADYRRKLDLLIESTKERTAPLARKIKDRLSFL